MESSSNKVSTDTASVNIWHRLETIERTVFENNALLSHLADKVEASPAVTDAASAEEYLTTRQAADLLGCSTRTIDRAVETGRIRPLLFGNGQKRKHRRFRLADLRRLLEEG